jgi:hypothetical protein
VDSTKLRKSTPTTRTEIRHHCSTKFNKEMTKGRVDSFLRGTRRNEPRRQPPSRRRRTAAATSKNLSR